jgi:hypothetical protein
MRTLLTALLAVAAAGCGGGATKTADKPTEAMIKADLEEQRKVEAEERGPVKAKKK